MRIGYLGPKGTFSFEASKKIASEEDDLIEYKTIKDCIIALQNNEVDKSVVPIENSLQGDVTETVDTLVESNGIYVENEIIIKITQNLIANNNYKFEEIKTLYSHPQALAQCRNYIEQNLHNADIIQVSSTALSAKEIMNKDYCACIANKSCVEQYNLKLLEENIQDNDFNQTKFWVLSKTENEVGNKMSIIFSTKDKPGALYQVLGIFNTYFINLVKIESRPAKTVLGEYIFLVDLEVNSYIKQTIELLEKECRYIKILGRY